MALALACHPSGPTAARDDPPVSYDALRRVHPTQLTTRAPSVGVQRLPPTPPGATRVTIQSGPLALSGWLALPAQASAATPVPGLVYFHGSFALSTADFDHVQPALDAGFAVLLPALRGENGNPGALELLAGEVDDGVAAVATLAAQPAVDARRIFAFGHSVGGALAALVSLRPDARVQLTGSVGGIYVPATFERWQTMPDNRSLVRFDPRDPVEARLRTLLPNVADMVHPHHAFIGAQDRWFHANAAAVATAAAAVGSDRFVVHDVPGDHASSLAPGLAAFLQLAQEQGAAP